LPWTEDANVAVMTLPGKPVCLIAYKTTRSSTVFVAGDTRTLVEAARPRLAQLKATPLSDPLNATVQQSLFQGHNMPSELTHEESVACAAFIRYQNAQQAARSSRALSHAPVAATPTVAAHLASMRGDKPAAPASGTVDHGQTNPEDTRTQVADLLTASLQQRGGLGLGPATASSRALKDSPSVRGKRLRKVGNFVALLDLIIAELPKHDTRLAELKAALEPTKCCLQTVSRKLSEEMRSLSEGHRELTDEDVAGLFADDTFTVDLRQDVRQRLDKLADHMMKSYEVTGIVDATVARCTDRVCRLEVLAPSAEITTQSIVNALRDLAHKIGESTPSCAVTASTAV